MKEKERKLKKNKMIMEEKEGKESFKENKFERLRKRIEN